MNPSRTGRCRSAAREGALNTKQHEPIPATQPERRRVALAFMAHPDDAEFQCGGVLIRLAALGWEIHIASATAGDCGSATLARAEIARIRRAEGAAAARQIGATYHCLEERDVDVIFDHEANRKAIDLFRGIAPSLVFTHPREDYMLDHEQAHLLARSAAFAFAVPNTSELPLRPGSALPHIYYVDPQDGVNPYTGETVKPTTVIDIAAVIERKVEMLAAHASQREWLRAHHGVDAYIDAMKRHAAARGELINAGFAEAFVQHRGHAFPADDILSTLLRKS
jgi:LmbE family N-acetylglucosaminyl deacetylase